MLIKKEPSPGRGREVLQQTDLEVRWSPEASDDLDAIAEYIASDSGYCARAVVFEMLSVSRSIGGFPLIGRTVPEIGDETIRERFIYSLSFDLSGRARKDNIVAVIHGKRLLENVADRFEERT